MNSKFVSVQLFKSYCLPFILYIHCHLEFTVGWTGKPESPQCHLPTQLEDVSVSSIPGALSALEALCDYALYKSTFTLHYITLHITEAIPLTKSSIKMHGRLY